MRQKKYSKTSTPCILGHTTDICNTSQQNENRSLSEMHEDSKDVSSLSLTMDVTKVYGSTGNSNGLVSLGLVGLNDVGSHVKSIQAHRLPLLI